MAREMTDREAVKIALQLAIDATTHEIGALDGEDDAESVRQRAGLEARVARFRRILRKRYGEEAARTPLERVADLSGSGPVHLGDLMNPKTSKSGTFGN